jgi:hypothetical protein
MADPDLEVVLSETRMKGWTKGCEMRSIPAMDFKAFV